LVRAEPIGVVVRLPSRLRRLGGKKKAELIGFIREHLSPTQLAGAIHVCFYNPTATGRALLNAHPDVVAKHPKKG